ncbi:ATP-binding protein [Aquipuribacter hungaricus]|uniref:ATP-binding protein n=1 Tax=Aquipuribacter hungaricus TaxID=545624 RepID=UPI0030EF69B6
MLDASLELLPEPGAASQARRWAGSLLHPLVGGDTTDTVELVLTELVQNAVLHAGTPMTLALAQDEDGVCVSVADGSAVLPSSGLTDAEAMSGRGLLMVAAVATTWGAEQRPGGKVVWACVPEATEDTGHGTSEDGDGPGDDADVDPEELLARWSDGARTPLQLSDREPLVVTGLPVATMLAVKTHNDDVFRELTLCAMEQHEPGEGPAAEVTRLARRAREVLASFADGRQQVRDQVLAAVRAGATSFDLTLAVDDRAVGVLDDYLAILEEADGWAERGLLLSEPPADEVLAVRRRYLTSLLAQLHDR